jgi:hypothetical protein
VETVGIKYCGMCNPEIDIDNFKKNLKSRLDLLGIKLSTKLKSVDALIIVNGCKVGCIKKKLFNNITFIVSINGTNIDFVNTEELQLVDKVVNKLTRGDRIGR